ncbi:MAG: glycerol-3-phosphate 1-O-acyltransferase PlsY [Pseudomonadota bacterium]
MLHDIMGLDRALPWLLGAFLAGYLVGSVPFGILVSRLFGLADPRTVGSGNIGATNVLRSGHKAAAAVTLLLDALKGAVPVLLFLFWGDLAAQAAGLGALIGHCFPVWLRFRGGKGVATFLGLVAALYWPAGAAAALTWLVAAGASRISSLAALVSAASAPVWLWGLGRLEAVLAVALAAVLVWARHHANIGRLLRGEEPRIGR